MLNCILQRVRKRIKDASKSVVKSLDPAQLAAKTQTNPTAARKGWLKMDVMEMLAKRKGILVWQNLVSRYVLIQLVIMYSHLESGYRQPSNYPKT